MSYKRNEWAEYTLHYRWQWMGKKKTYNTTTPNTTPKLENITRIIYIVNGLRVASVGKHVCLGVFVCVRVCVGLLVTVTLSGNDIWLLVEQT